MTREEEEQLINDTFKFDSFMMEKVSVYFNTAAQNVTNPVSVRKYEGLSQTFAQAAKIMDKMGDGATPTFEEITMLQQITLESRNFADNGMAPELEKYALSHVQEFIDANPDSWARIEQHLPFVAEKIKPFLK